MDTPVYEEHLGRLITEQERSCQETERKISQWESFKSDYDALKGRLGTLPDEITHDVMVPFGSLAFMPGQLVHTNEILVLLGENWFVERSAKQATEIVDRRLKSVESQLDDLHKQRRLLEPRQTFTSDLQAMAKGSEDMQDIREEYNEEKERQWRDSHRQRVKEHKRRIKETGATGDCPGATGGGVGGQAVGAGITDEQLWARLDELEIKEAEGRELEDDGPAHEARQSPQAWTDDVDPGQVIGDDSYSASDELDSDDDFGESDSDVVATSQNVLHFSHTNSKQPRSSALIDPAPKAITSPGDIYPAFLATLQPTSILKPSTHGNTRPPRTRKKKRAVAFESDSTTAQVSKGVTSPQQTASAFTDRVVEKCPGGAVDVVGGRQQGETGAPDLESRSHFAKQARDGNTADTQENKPVSRFRARRRNVNQT